MYQHHKLKVERTAQFSTIGNANKNTTRLVMACHGQGQLAKHFVRRFDVLDDGKTLVIAPEALSKFYIKDMQGDVGACWMTKEDRLDEISDYANYLQQLYDHFVPMLADEVEIIFFWIFTRRRYDFQVGNGKIPKSGRFYSFWEYVA